MPPYYFVNDSDRNKAMLVIFGT